MVARRTLSQVDAALEHHMAAVRKLRRERIALAQSEMERKRAAARADFESGRPRADICRQHGITIGQLAGWANRGAWQTSRRDGPGRKDKYAPDQRGPIKEAYEDPGNKIAWICAAFEISTETLRRYVSAGNWQRPEHPLRSLTVLQHATYRRLRPHVGRAAALAEARREVTA